MTKQVSFRKLPTCGMWKDRPQTPFEQDEVLERIKASQTIQYLNLSDTTYGFINAKESDEGTR